MYINQHSCLMWSMSQTLSWQKNLIKVSIIAGWITVKRERVRGRGGGGGGGLEVGGEYYH